MVARSHACDASRSATSPCDIGASVARSRSRTASRDGVARRPLARTAPRSSSRLWRPAMAQLYASRLGGASTCNRGASTYLASGRRPVVAVVGVRLEVEVILVRDRIVLRREQRAEHVAGIDRPLDIEQQRVALLVVLGDHGLAAGVVDD